MVAVSQLLVSSAGAAVVQMSNEEVIQRSKLIFVGSVIEKKARWNEKGNLIVTDYRFKVDQVLFGNKKEAEIVLTFAGGQLPEEGQAVSGVPEFLTGDNLLLMVEDPDTQLLSPVTGMHQGIIPDDATATKWQSNASTRHLSEFSRKKWKTRPGGGNRPFQEVVNEIKAQIPVAKGKPLPDRSVPAENQGAILRDLPSKQYETSASANQGSESSSPPASIPGPSTETPPLPDAVIDAGGGPDTSGPGEGPEEWSYSHRAKNVPIVFNPLPNSYNHDQYMMSQWNDYCDIYRVIASTGTWSWGNGRYDIAGWVNNATMISQFGSGWGANTLAVCWLRWDGTGFSIEADIAMNPAFSWSTDDYATYNNTSLHSVHQTFLHEIGHSWGLDHNWYALSVMNYSPHKYRAYVVLNLEDTMAVRSAFPGNAVARTDLGNHLFYASAYQDYDDSTLSTTVVQRGGSFTVSNFIIENVGTTTVGTPTVYWYLTPSINSFSGSIYIGSTTHASLGVNSYFNTSRTLSVPASTAIGTYYLAAYIGYTTGDSIGNNNSTWLDRLISVTCPSLSAPTGVSATDGTLCNVVRVSWNAVSGATSYNIYRNGVYIGNDTASPYNDAPGNTSTHSYTVRASNGCGLSALSTANSGWANAAPATPSGVAASDGTYCGQVRITWNAAARATSYDIYRNGVFVANDAASPFLDVPGNTSTHSYTVRARNTCGTSGLSAANSGWANAAPPAPAGVSASDGTAGCLVRVSWTAAPRATSYEVYRDGALVGTPAASPYDDNPGDNNPHSYTVRAKNACGTSTFSSPNTGYADCPPACTEVAWVTSFTPGTLRNDIGGWRGNRFRVGASPIEVVQLGRVFINGNGRDHELRIVRVSDKAVVASAVWTAAGGVHNQIKYVSLAAAVTLAANTEYYLVSQENAGGDYFYSFNTQVNTTAAASVVSAIYSTDGVTWSTPGGSTGNYSYVPVGLKYCEQESDCVETRWVTGFTPGTPRNDSGGWRGNRFRVGAAPVEVVQLGRVFLNGNSQSHELRIVRVSDKATVASATWTPAGGLHNQLKYVPLAAAVTLAANTEYYLVSREVAAGDFYYSFNTGVATTGVAAIQSAIYSTDGVNWFIPGGSAGSWSYVPVGFLYCGGGGGGGCVETPLVSSFTPGSRRNDVGSWRGNRLRVGASAIEVRKLGRVFLDGNVQTHVIRLVRVSDKAVVASANWTPAGGTHNQIKYVDLASPVTLAAGTEYYLASQEYAGGDYFYNFNTTVVTSAGGTVLSAIYSIDGTTWTVPSSGAGSFSYVPVSLVYCAPGGGSALEESVSGLETYSEAEAVETVGVDLGSVVIDNGYLVLPYVRTGGGGADYIVEISEDAENWVSAEGLIEETVTALDDTTALVEARFLVPVDQTAVRYLRLQVVSGSE
jgi:hypothetical protein